jgi:hypothetical protein
LSSAAQAELYLFRKHLGMSAWEVENTPVWELEALMAGIGKDQS